MAAIQPPTFLPGQCYEPTDLRYERYSAVHNSGVMFHDTQAELAVTTAGTGLSVDVAAGGAVMVSGYSTPGAYHGQTSASVVRTSEAAEASPRIDTVVARVIDNAYEPGTQGFEIEILKGTATAGAQIADPQAVNYLAGKASVVGKTVAPLAYLLVPAGFTGPFVNATHIRDARQSPLTPYIRLESTGTTAIGAAMVKVNLATTSHIDNDNYSVSASIVTVKKTGLYDAHAPIFNAGGAAGNRINRIYVNGVAVGFAQAESVLNLYGNVTLTHYLLNANDTVEVRAQGVATSVASGSLTIRRVG